MSQNVATIKKFYTAFQQLDAATMNSCYGDDIVFFDPVFGLLKGAEAKSMWQMLCKNARQFSLTFGNITELDEEYCTCDWTAAYVFSATGKQVVNKVKANMRFENGKIIEHSDAFSVHKWSKQAFGLTGILLGWNSFFQTKIKNTARKNLMKFIEAKNK